MVSRYYQYLICSTLMTLMRKQGVAQREEITFSMRSHPIIIILNNNNNNNNICYLAKVTSSA